MQTKNEVKPKPIKSKKGKKIIDQQLIARFEKQSKEPHQSSGRRRLKKLYEVNQSQEILNEEPNEQKLDQPLEEVIEYKQFKVQDDEDMKKEKERQQEAKKNKKLKGNQPLEKFFEKVAKTEHEKLKKQEKIKISKNQWTPEQLERIKKEKKKIRKSSDDFLPSDGGDISEQDEKFIEARRIAAYQVYNNGSIDDQNKLIQKALQLSLTPATKEEEYNVQEKLKQKIKNVPKHLNFKEIKQNSKNEVANNSTLMLTQRIMNPFDGLFITIVGQFTSYQKDDLIEVIQRLGGQCSSKLTKKCNLVIYGQYAINNFKKRTNQPLNQTNIGKDAQAKNIPIIKNQNINSFFLQKTGNHLQHYLQKNTITQNLVSETLKLLKIIPEKNPSLEIKESIISHQPTLNREQNQIANKHPIFKQPQKQKEQKMEIQYPKPQPQTMKDEKIRDYRMWTQKYKPISLEDVIGQNNQIKSLCEWLQSWEDIQVRGNKREVKEGRGWNAAGSINSKAALLSGDPGIGKTTTARLIAARYNYKITEFNASDVRNKSGIDLMPSGTHSLNISNTQTMLTKRLIIMDEVDGMSSGDRGGITAIINMIKNTKAPIICICNDRTCEKIRSLAGHCLDIKFQKPQKNFVVTRLKSILSRQGGSGQDRALEQLVDTFQNDMRQILSYLEIIFKTVSKNITFDVLKRKNEHAKDASVMINHQEATRTLLNRSQFRKMTIQQKVQCFFIDSDIVPLMVHQNILSSTKKTKFSPHQFRSFVQGIHGMVVGDLLDRTIRKQQEWSLMPSYGFMTCVYPTQKMSQSLGFSQFPSWLGKNSSERKMKRLARQLKDYMLPVTLCANWKAVKANYGVLILQQLVQMLKKQQIEQACVFLQTYNITPMVLSQNLTVLQYNQQKNSLLAQVPSQIKGKLTRLFNKRHEDLKLKAVKNTKGKTEHIKFDPVLQQAQDANVQQEQQVSEQQQNDKDVKVKQKQIKNKKK